jgi:hypothetical protein
MPDQETGRPAPAEADGPDGPAIEPSAKPDQPFGDLSEAARGVVHSPADPRLEKHLARIGLSEGDPASPRSSSASDGAAMEQLARLQSSLDIANWRLRVLLWLVVLIAAAVAVMAVIVISR